MPVKGYPAQETRKGFEIEWGKSSEKWKKVRGGNIIMAGVGIVRIPIDLVNNAPEFPVRPFGITMM